MANEVTSLCIIGITQRGNKFRPSDWVERIASLFAEFGTDHRLRYSPMVMPVRHENLPSLFVAGELAQSNPTGYRFIIEFAFNHHLQIKTIGKSPQPQKQTQLQDVA